MKKLLLLILFIFTASYFVSAQKVNDKVQIEHNGTWYNGTIIKVNATEAQYFVSYEGWSESWNEWVSIDRLKGFGKSATKASTGTYNIGDRVQVINGTTSESAKIISVGENKYEVEFEKKELGKKWMMESQLKKL